MLQKRIWPVLLSGGVGARLWPVSRVAMPKQLLGLTGSATMLQATAQRCDDNTRFHPPLIVASATHAAQIGAQLAAIGIAPAALILEPVARNTAPAIALAALEVLRRDPDGVMLVMPSDHHIADPQALQVAINAAWPFADSGWLVTFGITPDSPATGYGYIEIGAPLADDVNKVAQFVEKPDVATATRWLAAGHHAWNGGIFLLRADALCDALATHAQPILAACTAAFATADRDDDRITPDAALFAACPANSIDYAVLEQAARVAVVPVTMGWSDIGSWDALRDLGPGDADGNVCSGAVLTKDSRNCLLRSDGPIIAAIGVENLVIVATEDAVLVCAAGQTQAVRGIVDRLAGDAALVAPRVEVHRWGRLRWLTQSNDVRVSEVSIIADALWTAPDGRITVIDGAVSLMAQTLQSGQSINVAHGTSILATTGTRLLVVEIDVKAGI